MTKGDRSTSRCSSRDTPINAYFRSSKYFLTERACLSDIFESCESFAWWWTWHDISDEMHASYDRAKQVAVRLGTRIYRLLRCIFAANDRNDLRNHRGAELHFLMSNDREIKIDGTSRDLDSRRDWVYFSSNNPVEICRCFDLTLISIFDFRFNSFWSREIRRMPRVLHIQKIDELKWK